MSLKPNSVEVVTTHQGLVKKIAEFLPKTKQISEKKEEELIQITLPFLIVIGTLIVLFFVIPGIYLIFERILFPSQMQIDNKEKVSKSE